MKKIVVLTGGPSLEAEVSRRSGAAALSALHDKGIDAVGLEFDPKSFTADMIRLAPDVVFNAVHGEYGEDGRVQAALDMIGIPYTGSGVLASALTMDKAAAKMFFFGAGISTPKAEIFRKGESGIAGKILEKFPLPVVVKAPKQGSSIGVVIVTRGDEIENALKEAFKYGDTALVEDFITGMELTVAVMGNAENAEAMPVIEITTESGRYDYESKYTAGASHHIIPARIDENTARSVRELAVKTFSSCGCRGVARVDIMLSAEKIPYVIDVNTVPGMTETSLVPDAARAMGFDFGDFCLKLIEMI